MASVKAGEAYVELGVRDKLDAGLKQAAAKMNAVGKKFAMAGGAITAAGGAIAGSLAAVTSSFASAGDAIDKASIRTGVTAEAFSAMVFAAEQSGAGAADLEKAFFGLSRSMEGLSRNQGAVVSAYKAIGLSQKDMQGLSPEQSMLKVADALSKIEDAGLRGAYAQQIFGRAGRQLMPMLLAGADGIQDMMKEADALGRTMSGKDAKAAADYVDAMNRLKSSVMGVKNQIGAALAPTMSALADTFVKVSKPIRDFISQNREMILGVALGGAALIALGTAITTAGFAFMGIGAALGAVASAIAFVTSPIGIAIAAFAALGTAVYKYTEFGGQAVDWFLEKIEPISEVISNTFARVQNALATGDLNAAFDAIVDGLEFSWLSVVDTFQGSWDMFVDWFFNVSKGLVKAVGGLFDQLGDIIKKALQAYGNYYNKVFNFVTEKIGEMGGVRTIGGEVDAFQNGAALGIDVDEIGDGISNFGKALKDSAEGIGSNTKADRDARDAERRARLDALKKDIAAGGAAARAEIEERKKMERPDLPKLPEFDGQLAGEAAEQAKSAARGTFSSFGALFLGGQDSIQKDQLKVQQKIADNTETMAGGSLASVFVA